MMPELLDQRSEPLSPGESASALHTVTSWDRGAQGKLLLAHMIQRLAAEGHAMSALETVIIVFSSLYSCADTIVDDHPQYPGDHIYARKDSPSDRGAQTFALIREFIDCDWSVSSGS
jgi:hypothetical protein